MRILHLVNSLVDFVKIDAEVTFGILLYHLVEKLLRMRLYMFFQWWHFDDGYLCDLWTLLPLT